MRNAGDAQRTAEVFEVLVVRNLAKIHRVAPAVGEQRLVVVGNQVAIVVHPVVVGQVFALQYAVAGISEIAKFATHLQAARRQQSRRQSRVVILGNVPVIGDAQLIAAPACAADLRRQDAGFAGIADGKRQVRRIENRDTLETQLEVAGLAHARPGIQFDIAGFDDPVVGFRRTGRVADVGKLQPTLLVDFEYVGRASRAVQPELELRALEADTAGFISEFRRAADDRRIRVFVTNRPHEHQCLCERVVVRRVGAGEPVAAPQDDAARQ